ncbi:LicD family protein [Leucobacter allii]|uniref:LicD family protein n=1 Tax=Leucobacter allii TaxID=2932247 RepID=A0ABY4FN50_9MICO|nr:LicD family protein [Leucobacter allii]UOQ57687.1 LicD family protein [Leucobacter allii]
MHLEIDGRRVWSVSIPDALLVPWPDALRQRLRGSAACRVVDAAGGAELWSGRVVWGGDGAPELVDPAGRPLALNKWGLMRPSFERDGRIRERVAAFAAEILGVLQEEGFIAFIVGGTLLGAERSGEILPHDDDADLAYLSPHEHPSDLVVENEGLRELLVARGYRVRRHSWAHLQILTGEEADVEYYVDIFTAFYRDGLFHEPIHVRAPGMEHAILPLGERELHGRAFPAPRDPDAWLSACYGPEWRTPDPTFSFDTPLPTRRRFDAWFGSYNLGRNPWEERYGEGGGGHESALIRPHVRAAGDAVVDLGSGGGEDLAAYRAAGLRAAGADYARNAPAVREGAALVNLVDYVEATRFLTASLRGLGSAARPVIAANHLLACQDPRGRETVLGLIALALRHGARAFSADYEELGAYAFTAPRTWHLEERVLAAEAAAVGLACTTIERGARADEDGVLRSIAVTEFQLAAASGE